MHSSVSVTPIINICQCEFFNCIQVCFGFVIALCYSHYLPQVFHFVLYLITILDVDFYCYCFKKVCVRLCFSRKITFKVNVDAHLQPLNKDM